MKAIILAAGQGSRLNKYTKDLPKTMLNVFGKPIIQHQVETFQKIGIDQIIVVTGYKAEKINVNGIKTYTNKAYDQTNMLESLFCAEDELNDDIIISYGDLVFEKRILEKVIESNANIGVVVDLDWKEYWMKRYGKIDFDLESLSFDKENNIIELGTEVTTEKNIDGRYVGLIKLSKTGVETIKKIYHEAKMRYKNKIWLRGRSFEKVFMTDFLQEMINQNNKIKVIKVKKGWLEFDTNEDYELVLNLNRKDELKNIYSTFYQQ
jgi:choline kinase